jgi:hypothetical protein
VGPFALGKPPGYQAGDLLVGCQQGTFFSGTHPVESAQWPNIIINTSTQIVRWRIATGDANDDWTVNVVSGSSVHSAQMAAFDLKGLTGVSNVQGGNLLTNDGSFTTAFPASGIPLLANDQTLTLNYWFKSQNNSAGAVGVIDNLPGVVTGEDEIATLDAYVVNGLAGNPGGARSSWGGWTYWITAANPADALAFGTDQTESPESSGFEVVSVYSNRLRIIT